MFGWQIVKVCGDSMSPRLPARSYAVFRRVRRVRVGDIVLADHAKYGRIIKRVRCNGPDGVGLEGLSPHSTSPKELGLVARQCILGRLVFGLREPSSA